MPTFSSKNIFILLVFVIKQQQSHAFYIPGVMPNSYEVGESVSLKVNKLTSARTQIDLDYYDFPVCVPKEGIRADHENIGEFLAGDRILSSPYVLRMKEDMFCEQVCVVNVGPVQTAQDEDGKPVQTSLFKRKKKQQSRIVHAIRSNYYNNWIVDNLPSASIFENDEFITTRYWGGFPVGFVGTDQKAYINNHVNIIIHYHQMDDKNSNRIVRFLVEPFSIKHDFSSYSDGRLNDPIESCKLATLRQHTTYEMVTDPGRQPQVASGLVLFTYDVIWIEEPDVRWASRWDIYLNMDHNVPAKVHWFSIVNSIMVVLALAAMIAFIFSRQLKRDVATYSQISTTEDNSYNGIHNQQRSFHRMLLHGDIFLAPTFSPSLFSVACGTGAQLLLMLLITIFFAALGFASPEKRGHFLMVLIGMYILLSYVNGYVTGKLYETFQGTDRKRTYAYAAIGYPSVAFSVFLLMNFVALINHSTDAVPFVTLFIMIFLWFGISTPLVYVGASHGRKYPLQFPVVTSSIRHQHHIPDQPFFLRTPILMLLGGLLPFASCFVELFYVMSSVWMHFLYHVFGFLLLVLLIVIIVSSQFTILLTYFQLIRGNYHWWWNSFCIGGSVGIYIFLYGILYFRGLEANTFATYVLYFGYMVLYSIAFFCMMGVCGVFAMLYFTKQMYASIMKLDDAYGINEEQIQFHLHPDDNPHAGHSLYMEMT